MRYRVGEREFGLTTNVPMLNSTPKPSFCLTGSVSDMTMGMGTAMIKMSLLRLKVA